VIPVPVPGSMAQVSILRNIPTFLAYDRDSNFYLALSEKPTVTEAKLLFLEDLETTLNPANYSSCLLSIINDDILRVPTLCQFSVLTDSLKSDLLILDRHGVLATNVLNMTLICSNKQPQKISCGASCRISLPSR